MLSEHHSPLITGALPAILVVAVSALSAIAILAWLVHAVACRAIDKAAPDSVAPVVLALSALLGALKGFLPWSRLRGPIQPPVDLGDLLRADNELDQALPRRDQQ